LLLLYLIVIGAFLCLFPLAFYLLTLANWNGRRRPVFLSGPADFGGVLLATAGFLILGGPLILAGLHEIWRRSTLTGSFHDIRVHLPEPSWPWYFASGAYLLLVVGGAAWLLIRRLPVSVIYNIDPADADNLVPVTLNRMGLSWARRGSAYWIEWVERIGIRRIVADVTIAPVMRHMTLRWIATPVDVRPQVEAELRQTLAKIDSPVNPLAAWLLTAATGLFALLLGLLGWFLMILWRLRS
jgi:hypothetical protein